MVQEILVDMDSFLGCHVVLPPRVLHHASPYTFGVDAPGIVPIYTYALGVVVYFSSTYWGRKMNPCGLAFLCQKLVRTHYFPFSAPL